MTLTVAQEIKNQIMALDYWALANWGTHSYRADERSLSFKCSGLNIQRGGYIKITLSELDLYSIFLYRFTPKKFEILAEAQAIYYDNLVSVINAILNDPQKPFWLSK